MSRDALVVGINAYQFLPGLNAPARDAEAIAHRLQTSGEFRVQRVPEIVQDGQPKIGAKARVTLKELEAALVNLFKPKGSNIPQTALFYFSGHGIQKEAGINEGYLAVSDSNPDVGFYGLSLFWLRRLLQESPVRQRIVLLDCCNSGEFLNFLEADPGARPGTDRLFMAASREYEAAYESLDAPFSVFTKVLLEGLDPDRVGVNIITNHTLTAWVSRAMSSEIQQPLFENSGSEIILTRQTGVPTQIQSIAKDEVCPYRGLEFFDEAHAEYFFGREELTDHLIEKLRQGRFVSVVGASGSGKSSLVRAGLIWELRRGRKFSGSDRWDIKLFTPGEHPLKSLAAAFIDASLPDLERAEQLRRVEAFLQDGGQGLAQLVRATLPCEPGTTTLPSSMQPHMLLVIDQFEEVFTLCRGTQTEQERQQFFDVLLGALHAVGDRLSCVAVIRADFLTKCSLYHHLAQQIERNLVLVTPLSYDQIKATIVQPAQKVGLHCEPNLIYTMLLDVIGAPGELPLLQYTLLELWQRRQVGDEGHPSRLTLDTYTELGGIRGTLQKRATEIFCSLTSEEQVVAKRVFLALTQLGEGTEDTRRRILKSELVSPAFPVELVDRTLEKLINTKLVITNRNSDEVVEVVGADAFVDEESGDHWVCQETIDVVHEALIRNWPLLRNWLDENREMLRRQRRIEQSALEWQAAGQPTEAEYLLRGNRLIDAEDFVGLYSHELSALSHRYIKISQEESQRARQESRLLQIAVPSVLFVALVMTFNQYHSALQTQADKNYQLHIATSRERAAIAQNILKEPNGDPASALLVSRLAAEQGEATLEAQSSLREALKTLRLQVELPGLGGSITQTVFSLNQNYLATGSSDGKIQLWKLGGYRLYATRPQQQHVLNWHGEASNDGSGKIAGLALSPDGRRVAAIAQGSREVQVWDTESGNLLYRLQLQQFSDRLQFSANGKWFIALTSDRTVGIWDAQTGQMEATVDHSGAIQSFDVSRDGKLLLTAGQTGRVQIWQVTDLAGKVSVTPLRSLIHPTAVTSAAFSGSGQLILTNSQDNRPRIWDANTGNLRSVFTPHPQRMIGAQLPGQMPAANPAAKFSQVLLSPNEQLVALATTDGQLWLWQTATGQYWTKLSSGSSPGSSPPEGDRLSLVSFSPDSHALITASPLAEPQQYMVQLWNSRTGSITGNVPHLGTGTGSIQMSADGTYVATSGARGDVFLWATERGGELPTVTLPYAPARWLAIVSPPAQTHSLTEAPSNSAQVGAGIVAIAPNRTYRRWDLWVDRQPQPAPPSPSASPALHTARIENRNIWKWLLSLISNRTEQDQEQTANASLNQTQRFANQTRTSSRPQPVRRSVPLTAATVSQDGQWLATADADGWVEVRPAIAPASSNPTLRFQNIRVRNDGQNQFNPANKPEDLLVNTIHHLRFSPDGQKLLAVSDDHTMHLWNAQSGQLLRIFRGHRAAIIRAEFSPNREKIISVSQDNTVQIWQVATGQSVRTISSMKGMTSASFNPSATQIVLTGIDGIARLLDLSTGRLTVVFAGHRGKVTDAHFSPDGRSLVTAGADGTARIWDAAKGTELAQLQPNAAGSETIPLRQSSFSADGQYVVALADDGRVHVWAANWQSLLQLARDRSTRQLTPEECVRYLRLSPEMCPRLDNRSSESNSPVNP